MDGTLAATGGNICTLEGPFFSHFEALGAGVRIGVTVPQAAGPSNMSTSSDPPRSRHRRMPALVRPDLSFAIGSLNVPGRKP